MTKLLKYAVVPILCIAVCVTVVFIVRGTGKKGGADVELLREGAGDEEDVYKRQVSHAGRAAG